MSLRDAEYKKIHLTSLAERNGYQGNKDWDNFIEMAIKYEDEDVLNKMLTLTINTPSKYSQYVMDLFLIYKQKPDFFINVAEKFYGNDSICVARLLKTDPEIISNNEFKNVSSGSSKFKQFSLELDKLDFKTINETQNIKKIAACDLIKKAKIKNIKSK